MIYIIGEMSSPSTSNPPSKCLYNQQNTTVNEAIHGYLLTRPDLVLLAGLPGIRVIGRRSVDRTKVRILESPFLFRVGQLQHPIIE